MRKNLVFTPLMVALVSGGAAYAQDTSTAVLTGRVTSQDGQSLRGVRVIIESPALLGARQAVTDANGQFRTPLLPNGEYTITYTLNGYLTRRLRLRLIAGQTANANASLTAIGVAEATVEVTADTSSVAQVDKTDTVVQTSYSSDFLEKVIGRNFDSIAGLAPGLSGSTSFGTDQAPIIRGGSGYGSVTLVNGASVKDMWNNTNREGVASGIPDLIESVAIIQSPLNSRYGNTDSGILSVVTSRGSNQFSGSVRLYSSRGGGWNAVDEFSYPRRDGTSAINNVGGTDLLSKRYEITVKGPIWKDRVTFAYGANVEPRTPSEQNRGTLFYNWGDGRYGRAQDNVGTFYEAPNGDVIRKPELYLRNNPARNPFQRSDTLTHNQFTIFGQITPNHQLEWHYFQRETQTTSGQVGANDDGWIQEETGAWNVEGRAQRTWSLAYKGVIGSSGLVEARVGNTYYEFFHVNGRSPVPRYPIMLTAMPSRIPIEGGNPNDFNSYYSNGYISAYANSTVASNPNPFATTYRYFHNSSREDTGDAGGTQSIVLNYQHLLATNMGAHMIDVGMNSEKFTWSTNNLAPYRFYAAGQIAWDLSDVNGLIGDRSDYAGRYIVFNPTLSTPRNIDPRGVARYGVANADTLFIDAQGNVTTHYLDIIPRVNVRFGTSPAYVYSDAVSYYINDLWSINDNHSVMAGVRFDNFKAYDTEKTVVNYTQPTFRAEYKWDIHGDQSRLLNVSWGQFHNNPGVGTFRPVLTIKNQNSTTWYWTGAALNDNRSNLNAPYLVIQDELMNLGNYTYRNTPVSMGGNTNTIVDPDFRALISTEFSVGFRRSLNNGGYWKLSFVNRTFANDYDFYPGEEFQHEDGRWDIRRVMRNADGNERSYRALELEWDFPINKRSRFGGSYTYARFMSNTAWETDSAVHWQILGYDLNLDWWWDQQFGGRDVWNPARPQQPEHTFRYYLTFDLSSGKMDSSLTFLGSYRSGSFYGTDVSGFRFNLGMPSHIYPNTLAPNGDTATGANWAPWPGAAQWVPTNNLSTYQDNWSLDLRYLISVPLAAKFAWHTRITVGNVFNHRGIGDWFSFGSANTTIVPNEIMGPSGNVAVQRRNDYDNGYRNVWRPGGTYDGNTQYVNRMGGRSFSFETGLRF